MPTAKQVLTVARAQIGVKESPPGSNNVIFNTHYYGREVYDGLWGKKFPWCASFQWDNFRMAGASELFYGGRKTASCTELLNYYRQTGQIVPFEEGQPGDLALYNWAGKKNYADHVGLLESIDVAKGTLVAIEGNTSIGNDSNGGMVMRRTRRKSQVVALARPKYDKEEEVNMTNEEVKELIQQEVAAETAKLEAKNAAELIQLVQTLSEQIVRVSQELRAELTPKVYTTVDELPAWAQPVVQHLLDKGILHGDGTGKLYLTDRDLVTASMVKELSEAGADKTFNTVAECPEWAQEAVQWAVDSGHIQGDEHGDLRLDACKIWSLQVDYNQFKAAGV